MNSKSDRRARRMSAKNEYEVRSAQSNRRAHCISYRDQAAIDMI